MVMRWRLMLLYVKMTGTFARNVWYVQALRRDAEIGCGNVMNHVAASTLTAVIVARWLIAFAVGGAVVVDHNAILVVLMLLVTLTHEAAWYDTVHMLVQVIMVEMIMMTICTIR
jgi:hypothetical protein